MASKFLTINSLALLLGACLYPSTVLAADRLRIGLSSFTPINAALWIAEEKGLFKKHADLDVLAREAGHAVPTAGVRPRSQMRGGASARRREKRSVD